MKRSSVLLFLLLGLFFLLVAPVFLEPPLLLAFGWIFAVRRFIGSWHWNGMEVGEFVLAAGVGVAGIHAFVCWLHPHRRTVVPENGKGQRTWQWRWTLALCGMGFCGLLATVSGILTTHQLYWLAKSPEPWLENRTRKFVSLLRAAADMQKAAVANEWNGAETRLEFNRLNTRRDHRPTIEAIEPIWIEGSAGKLDGIVLIDRKPLAEQETRYAIIRPGTENFIGTTNDFSSLLQPWMGKKTNTASGKGEEK